MLNSAWRVISIANRLPSLEMKFQSSFRLEGYWEPQENNSQVCRLRGLNPECEFHVFPRSHIARWQEYSSKEKLIIAELMNTVESLMFKYFFTNVQSMRNNLRQLPDLTFSRTLAGILRGWDLTLERNEELHLWQSVGVLFLSVSATIFCENFLINVGDMHRWLAR